MHNANHHATNTSDVSFRKLSTWFHVPPSPVASKWVDWDLIHREEIVLVEVLRELHSPWDAMTFPVISFSAEYKSTFKIIMRRGRIHPNYLIKHIKFWIYWDNHRVPNIASLPYSLLSSMRYLIRNDGVDFVGIGVVLSIVDQIGGGLLGRLKVRQRVPHLYMWVREDLCLQKSFQIGGQQRRASWN